MSPSAGRCRNVASISGFCPRARRLLRSVITMEETSTRPRCLRSLPLPTRSSVRVGYSINGDAGGATVILEATTRDLLPSGRSIAVVLGLERPRWQQAEIVGLRGVQGS